MNYKISNFIIAQACKVPFVISYNASVLAWKIPGKGEPGGLPSMGSHRVGHNWSDLAVAVLLMEMGTINVLFYNILLFYIFTKERPLPQIA